MKLKEIKKNMWENLWTTEITSKKTATQGFASALLKGLVFHSISLCWQTLCLTSHHTHHFDSISYFRFPRTNTVFRAALLWMAKKTSFRSPERKILISNIFSAFWQKTQLFKCSITEVISQSNIFETKIKKTHF